MIDFKKTNDSAVERPHMVWVEVTDARGRTRLTAQWVATPTTIESVRPAQAA